MEQKTIIQEMLESRSHENRKIDRAHLLMNEGKWSAAEDVLNKLLAEEPENEEALFCKMFIERRKRLNIQAEEVKKAVEIHEPVKAQPVEIIEETVEEHEFPEITNIEEVYEESVQEEPAEKWRERRNPLRSKKAQFALVVAVTILFAATAAVFGISARNHADNLPDGAEAVVSDYSDEVLD